jgi:anti-anti-sigma factor
MLLHVTRNEETALVRISGKVGWENSRVLDRQVETLVQAGVRRLVFHLAEVDFLSSGAIGVISYNWRRMKELEGELLVVEPNDYVVYLFRSVGFLRVFEGKILASLEDLDAHLAKAGRPPMARIPGDKWESIDSSFDDDDELSYREDQP